MTWKVTLEEKSMLLDDLSGDEFFDACKDHPEVSWLRLFVSPATHPDALYDLLCICARHMEVAPPPKPEKITDSVGLLKYLEQVDDDLPRAFDEHGNPLETTGAEETETTTSSTSTKPDSGTPVEPEPPL